MRTAVSAADGARWFLLAADGWGGDASAALVLSRTEGVKQLQVQRMAVDARGKSVGLLEFGVEAAGGALPETARLVAAQLVEDQELAVRFVLLAFLEDRSGDQTESSEQTGARRKRRRSSSSDSSKTSHATLWFARLTCVDKQHRTAQLRLLNCVEVPSVMMEAASANVGDSDEVQIHLTDGPFAVVFTPRSQMVLVLTMIQEGDAAEFHCWRNPIDVRQDGDDTPVKRIVSVNHISENMAPHSHLLIHTVSEQISASRQGERNRWLSFPTDERLPESLLKPSPAVYVPTFSADSSLVDEQVVCVSIMNGMDAISTVSSPSDWVQTLTELQIPVRFDATQRIDLSVNTLLVVGTTTNSIYVYTNGLVVASLVLPATPISIHTIGNDNDARRSVISVHCSNRNRSWFLLSFDPTNPNETIEILQGFKHVGDVLIGEFCFLEGNPSVLPAQVLLLNHVATESADAIADDPTVSNQLVKRSVLLHQPSAREKTVCLRLRLREPGGSKKERGVKRPRDPKPAGYSALKYIERTHKGVFHADTNEDDSRGENVLSASQPHLDTLVNSLENRVANGLLEFERLKAITQDKKALREQLNRLVMGEWWTSNRAQAGLDSSLLSCSPAPPPVNGNEALSTLSILEGLEEVVGISKNADDDLVEKTDAFVPFATLPVISCALRLKYFRVLQYFPQTSTLRMEVSIINTSSRVLLNTFATISLSPVRGDYGTTFGAPFFTARSSEVSAFQPQGKKSNGGVVLFLDISLEQSPLDLLRDGEARLAGIVWLHWNATCDPKSVPEGGRLDAVRFVDQSPKSFPVAAVDITAAELMVHNSSLRDNRGTDCTGATSAELLLLSAGSNIPMWFHRLKTVNAAIARRITPTLVRPTFALANYSDRDEQQSAFFMGQFMKELPRDVYAIHNPLRTAHVVDLLRCLCGLRREVLSIQRRSLVPPDEDVSDSKDMEIDEGNEDPVSDFVRSQRGMQRETDLRVVALIHVLKERAEFHDTWFGNVNATK